MMFGGGGGGGRRMLRIAGRAVTSCSVCGTSTATASSSSSSNAAASSSSCKLKSSSSSSSHNNNNNNNGNSPVSLSSNSSSVSSSAHSNNNLLNGFAFCHSFSDTDTDTAHDWAFVDNNYDYDYDYDDASSHLFSVVPSEAEVDHAISALQQVFGPASHSQLVREKCDYKLDNELDHVIIPGLVDQVSSDGSEPDWKEPSLFPYNSKVRQANGFDRFNYAFHLLQTEPYVQRMVKSLSSDKAVWDAVLNNEVVRELREISADKEHVLRNSDDTRTTRNVVMWIFDTAKAKFMEVIEMITKTVIELFQPAYHKTIADAEGSSDSINDNLRTAFMLSIMVLLVVVVGRGEAKA